MTNERGGDKRTGHREKDKKNNRKKQGGRLEISVEN